MKVVRKPTESKTLRAKDVPAGEVFELGDGMLCVRTVSELDGWAFCAETGKFLCRSRKDCRVRIVPGAFMEE